MAEGALGPAWWRGGGAAHHRELPRVRPAPAAAQPRRRKPRVVPVQVEPLAVACRSRSVTLTRLRGPRRPCESSMELLRLTAVVARGQCTSRRAHVAQAVGVVLRMDGGGALAWQRRSS
jgi:hypothetical protein